MPDKKRCFMPRGGIPCVEACMAFRQNEDGDPECVLLHVAEGIVGALTGWNRAALKTRHPASAPPPEVKP